MSWFGYKSGAVVGWNLYWLCTLHLMYPWRHLLFQIDWQRKLTQNCSRQTIGTRPGPEQQSRCRPRTQMYTTALHCWRQRDDKSGPGRRRPLWTGVPRLPGEGQWPVGSGSTTPVQVSPGLCVLVVHKGLYREQNILCKFNYANSHFS